MEFLRKFTKGPEVSWPIAGLIVCLAGYLATFITLLVAEGMFSYTMTKLFLVGLAVLIFMTILFILSRIAGRTDIVDAGWGVAFIVAALAAFSLGDTNSFELDSTHVLVLVLVVIWGVRLAYTITRRLLTHPEDKRYVALRKSWKGNELLNTYVRIFVAQAVLATIISIAAIHVMISPAQPIGVVGMIGATVWVVGFFFESLGDVQLKQFLSNKKNKGKLMTSGLWKYTRHPNYFGEATMWWGIYVIALSTPYGWVTIITPALITFLLLFVSGVPMTEKSFEGKKGWKAYKEKTSMFFPLPPQEK